MHFRKMSVEDRGKWKPASNYNSKPNAFVRKSRRLRGTIALDKTNRLRTKLAGEWVHWRYVTLQSIAEAPIFGIAILNFLIFFRSSFTVRMKMCLLF